MRNSRLCTGVFPNPHRVSAVPDVVKEKQTMSFIRDQLLSAALAMRPAVARAASDLISFGEIAQMVNRPGASGPTRMDNELKSLGSGKTDYRYDNPDRSILEVFSSPMSGVGRIEITAPEFTSLCPKTGQPDFATIAIEYQPDKLCVESKSLKLYLGAFRQHGMFHEACVQRICDDLVAVLNPSWIKVQGQFSPRGGITFWPLAMWSKQWKEPAHE